MAAFKTPGVKILQLNVEGLSAAKRDVIHKLATDTSASVLLLQETHSTSDDQLPIPGFAVISHIHHKQYGVATYVREQLVASELCSSAETSPVQWNAIQIDDLTVVNVYKPPKVLWPSPPLPPFRGQTLYAGDFNSPHISWSYKRNSPDGIALHEWYEQLDLRCLYDPKQASSFCSARWNSNTNPDLAFITRSTQGERCRREILSKFPRSQHCPSLISTDCQILPTDTSNRPRWNFRKAN